ncbi:MAG: hypothetical protein L0Y56_09800 [Nitrospira sp.]|nr:hypothetical protein [Nitrospira sp.]
MAKPDLQAVRSKPSTGSLYRDDGKLGLAVNSIPSAADDSAAATAGVPIGGLYHTAGAVKVRLT